MSKGKRERERVKCFRYPNNIYIYYLVTSLQTRQARHYKNNKTQKKQKSTVINHSFGG